MDNTKLFYLFSTIAQTYGAIVGFIGMLIVFRIDQLNRYREICKDRAENPLEKCLDELNCRIVIKGLTADSFRDVWNKISEDKKGYLRQEHKELYDKIDNEVSGIERYVKWSNLIKWLFGFFLIYHLVIIIFSIFSIYTVPKLAWYAKLMFNQLYCLLSLSSLLIFFLMFSLYSDKLLKFGGWIDGKILPNKKGNR